MEVYLKWREWRLPRNAGTGPSGRQTVEEYLIDFCSFVEHMAETGKTRLDPGTSRDEFLAFMIEYFGDTPVQLVDVPDESSGVHEQCD